MIPRVGLALVVVMAATTCAMRAEAQTSPRRMLYVRPFAGAFVPTGDQRDLLKDAALIGAQVSYEFTQGFAVAGSFGWSPSEDWTSATESNVDLFQFDLGIEGRLRNLTPRAGISTRPYAVVGGGGRSYERRDVPGAGVQTNPLGYGAIGVDLNQANDRVGVRLEARDNITGFKGLRGELRDREARTDLQFTAALTFGFQ